jgi:thymidylate synthase (FAD)
MKIIEQSHEIISLPENLLGIIEQCARTCYKSEGNIGCTALTKNNQEICPDVEWDIYGNFCKNIVCETHSSHKIVKRLIARDHHAMIEFGDIIVRFVTNRGVTHELVRHRMASYAQESTRYVRYDGEVEFILPVWAHKQIMDLGNAWGAVGVSPDIAFVKACDYAEMFYQRLLKSGWSPEKAREVLPHSLKTEIVVKANIREWRHIFQLRCSKKAHPQIRALMLPLLAELKTKVPVVFNNIYPPKCQAVLRHGRGHMATTRCYLTGTHDIHETKYHNEGGEQVARWVGDVGRTGHFDDPPKDPDDRE